MSIRVLRKPLIRLGRGLLITFFMAVPAVMVSQALNPEFRDTLRAAFLKAENGFFVERLYELAWNHFGGWNDEGKKLPLPVASLRDIERHAEYASLVTGVRKDFLMGMLVVETDLGRNLGSCTYAEVEAGARASYEAGVLGDRAWRTFEKRRETIRDIAENIGYDPETLLVSCNPDPRKYVGTGGAMGVAQFMPDTWLEYHDRLVTITGKQYPDPWHPRDAILAMALKLSDVPGVKTHNRYAEMAASKMYLSGGTSWRYNWYAQSVQYWAQNYMRFLA